MNKFFKKHYKKYKEYDKIANFGEIGRRYFVMNSFDGILTMMGILLGSYFAGIEDAGIIITTSLAAAVAMSISGIWGTYLSEEAERKKSMRDLERATLSKLKNTKIHKASQMAIYFVSIIDGTSPLIASMIVVSPFFLSHLLPVKMMYYAAIGISFLLLILLGAFLGAISKDNVIINAFKMTVAGIVCILIIMALQARHF